jgi:EAL domain-containing protein (putative c-di-GMP-specific phosphodiesterase class I)
VDAGLRRTQTPPGPTPVTPGYNTGIQARPARPQPTPEPRIAPTPTSIQHLASDLRRAVACDEFVLRYRPVFDLVDGRVVAVEALVRWRHPDRGIVRAGQFVPLAEETGLIVPIGGWALREACRQAGAWNAARRSPLAVRVHLSARQLEEPDLPELVARALRDAGLDPDRLVLGITASQRPDDTGPMIARLGELRRLGVRLAPGDLGTGYPVRSAEELRRDEVEALISDPHGGGAARPR